MQSQSSLHPESAYFTSLDTLPTNEAFSSLARRVFAQVFRTDFTAPGFALIQFRTPITSHDQRRCMVALKEELSRLAQEHLQRELVYLSAARFNQQVTTKFHLDGAPTESFLMLGYEPSEVFSIVAMADYTRAAHDLGITPAQFLTDHNPMFTQGERQLWPFVTPLTPFQPAHSHILLINNSSQPYTPSRTHLLGVMHQASIPHPDPAKSRVVNSTMITTNVMAVVPLPDEAVRTFLETDHVSGSSYG